MTTSETKTATTHVVIGTKGGVRLHWHALPPGKPKAYVDKVTGMPGEAKFEATVLIDKKSAAADIEALRGAVSVAMGKKGWVGDNRPGQIRFALHDGDAKAQDPITGQEMFAKSGEEYRGHFYLSARSKTPPGVVVGPNKRPALDGDYKAGDFVVISLDAFAYQNQGAGIGFGLGNVWVIKRGDPLMTDTSKPVSEDFAGLKPAEIEDFDTPSEGSIDKFFGDQS